MSIQTIMRNFLILSLPFICVLILPLAGSAQVRPIIPADDRDLDRVIAKIRPYQEFARQCNSRECVKLTCAEAQDLQNRLVNARAYMGYAYYWNKRATASNMDGLMSVANESIAAGNRAAKVQNIVAWQEYVVNIASSLLDIASVGGSFDEIVNNPKLLEQKSYAEMAELLDTFYEGMKDAESLHNRLKQAQNGRDFPKPIADMMPALGDLSSDQMNDLKSTVSDVGSLIKAAQEQGRDWRKILKEGKGARSIGQIVGRIAKIYADAEIAERNQLVDSLLSDIVAQDRVQANLYRDLQRYQQRRNKAEDAFLALDRLVVNGSMTQCLLKLKCPSLNLNLGSKIPVSDEVRVIELGKFTIVAPPDEPKSWGRAMPAVNAYLPSVERLLTGVPDMGKSLPTALRLEKTSFKPGETFTVRFTAEDCLPSNAWAGIVSATVSHGTAAGNSANLKSPRFQLQGSSEGVMQFTAPAEGGSFDVRLNESTSGFEVASVSFKVESPTAKPIEDPGPDAWLEGLRRRYRQLQPLVERGARGELAVEQKAEVRRNLENLGAVVENGIKNLEASANTGDEIIAPRRTLLGDIQRDIRRLRENQPATDPNAIGWSDSVGPRRGQNGRSFRFNCAPNPAGTSVTVWGTDVYTDDSPICKAAVHAGLISYASGGSVSIEIRPGQKGYAGSVRNGVSTSNWGSWGGSYIFVRSAQFAENRVLEPPPPAAMTSPMFRIVGVAANDHLKMRREPGTNGAEIARIPSGATGVKSLGEERQVGTGFWTKVSYGGTEGWVNKRFLARQ